MKLAPQYEFTKQQDEALKKARFIEYITIAYLFSVIVLMYLVMGSSQAMKTAWIEDCLSLVPPICFIIGTKICWRQSTSRYPYGFHRVISILYLCAALALLLMGGYLLVDAVISILMQEHPSIGMQEFFGQDMWLGWWMVLVLIWGAIPPVILGHIKLGYARTLNDKILITDGKMNKADWMTAVAAIGGVLGVGYGLWWADAVAAALISFDILKDGWKQSQDAVTGLINRAPTSIEGGYIDLPNRIQRTLNEFTWVKSSEVRLCEHGHLFFGEGFVQTVDDNAVAPEQLRQAVAAVTKIDWRLQEFVITYASEYTKHNYK